MINLVTLPTAFGLREYLERIQNEVGVSGK